MMQALRDAGTMSHARDQISFVGMDIEAALKEVAALSDSKFGEDGQPNFNDQTKIMKGPRYQSPDLTA
jgi:hypothetical protein